MRIKLRYRNIDPTLFYTSAKNVLHELVQELPLMTTPISRGTPLSLQAKKLSERARRAMEEGAEDGYVSDEDEAADIEVADGEKEEVKESLKKKKQRSEKHKLAKELSDCVILCQSVSFKGFEHAANNCKSSII